MADKYWVANKPNKEVAVVAETAGSSGIAAVDVGAIVKLTKTILFSEMVDAGTTGTFTFAESIPAGATLLSLDCVALTGFTGDTSATITVGDGTDVDRYMTGTPSVLTTAANGLDLGVPSGLPNHPSAKAPVVVITSAADFTSVNAGSITLELYYIK